MEQQLLATLFELLAIDAPSGQEEKIANLLMQKLQMLGLSAKRDSIGNVIGFLPGEGKTMLLSAHMDRVPPGKGHTPIREGDILKSDGTTNLGVDDAGGIVIILEALTQVIREKAVHPPIVVVFTVGEEIGLKGAHAVDVSGYDIAYGIVYDNANETGKIITSGGMYEGFDVEIIGKANHPAKDLSESVNALKVFMDIDWMIGVSDNGASRINVGLVNAGTARNVVPGTVSVQGELRSTLDDGGVAKKLEQLENNIKSVCERFGAKYTFATHRHFSSYTVDLNEPLVVTYRQVIEARGGQLISGDTFIGSDSSALRGEKGLNVITVSTGVVNEHTKDEYIKISDLVLLTEDLVNLLKQLK